MELFQTRGKQEYESQVKDSFGNVHDVIYHKATFTDILGNVRGLIGVLLDITDRKRIEEAMQRTAERLRNLHQIDQIILQCIGSPEAIVQTALEHIRNLLHCERASVGIFDNDMKHVQVYTASVNEQTIVKKEKIIPDEVYAGLEIFKQGRIEMMEDVVDEVKTATLAQIFPLDGIRTYINLPLLSAHKFHGVLNVSWENLKTITSDEAEISGEVAGQITIAIEQANLLIASRQHASELEERVQERTFQLQLANKELEAFSYSISHDLRAPLRHIIGFIGIFLETKTSALTTEELGYLTTVTNSANEMGKLIDALLSFSRLNRSEIQKVSIETSELIQHGITLFEEEIKLRAIEIKISQLQQTYGDFQLMRQVWSNLISNAIKYTGKKEKAIIEIGSYVENHETVFFVKDNGVGFDKRYAEKLFGVFQRLHKSIDFEGIGIGLANVNRIVSRHGGRCWAEGEIDKGATFYFSLPSIKSIVR